MAYKKRLTSALVLGLYVTMVIVALNYLLGLVNVQTPAQLFGIPLATGVTSTVGSAVLNFINGIIEFDIASLFMLYISAVIIVLVGAFAIDYVQVLPKGKTNWQRLTLILLYGTAVMYILLVGFKMLSWSNLIGIVIWYSVVALSVGLVEKTIRL